MASNDTDNIRTTNSSTKTKKQKWEEKQLRNYFKLQIDEISYGKTWTWLRKGNLKRETESLLKAAKNHGIGTKSIIRNITASVE